MKIQDSTVLVTGANRGIGKAFADELLDRGAAKVYAAVRDVSTVTDPRLVPIQLDVTDPDRVAAVARELDDVQVVVNNAGVLNVSIPLSASLDVARVELETNYLSLVSMTQAFAPVLERNGGGAFVNMLSVFSWVATPLIIDLLGIEGRGVELHERGTHRAAAPGHPGGRRPRRPRRHGHGRRVRPREDPPGDRGNVRARRAGGR